MLPVCGSRTSAVSFWTVEVGASAWIALVTVRAVHVDSKQRSFLQPFIGSPLSLLRTKWPWQRRIFSLRRVHFGLHIWLLLSSSDNVSRFYWTDHPFFHFTMGSVESPAQSLSSISRLADTIKTNTSILDKYLVHHGQREPSFGVDGSSISIPAYEKEVLDARSMVLGAARELRNLILGPVGILMNIGVRSPFCISIQHDVSRSLRESVSIWTRCFNVLQGRLTS